MNVLYPFKFKPVIDNRIWGGDKIRTRLCIDISPHERCAEAWVLSGYEGKQTEVSNGFLAGNELNELVEVYMDDLVGTKVYEANGNVFPLLVKFIDARDWLSVQVHPDDETAIRLGLDNGKTEMWYINDAEEGSQLISGFSKKINQKQLLERLGDGTLGEVLNYEKVRTGDVFFMPAGRIHSLGPGILLTEIQQTSDATYRIYDWGRTDDAGNPRELHTDKALQALDFDVYPSYRNPYVQRHNETSTLISCPYFTTNLVELAQALQKNYEELDSFVIYVCLEGKFLMKHDNGDPVEVTKGEAVLIPAAIDVVQLFPHEPSRFLEVFVL